MKGETVVSAGISGGAVGIFCDGPVFTDWMSGFALRGTSCVVGMGYTLLETVVFEGVFSGLFHEAGGAVMFNKSNSEFTVVKGGCSPWVRLAAGREGKVGGNSGGSVAGVGKSREFPAAGTVTPFRGGSVGGKVVFNVGGNVCGGKSGGYRSGGDVVLGINWLSKGINNDGVTVGINGATGVVCIGGYGGIIGFAEKRGIIGLDENGGIIGLVGSGRTKVVDCCGIPHGCVIPSDGKVGCLMRLGNRCGGVVTLGSGC